MAIVYRKPGPRAKPNYPKLLGLMVEWNYTTADLGDLLLVTGECVLNRLSNKHPWRLDEMYKIMDHFRWPYERMHELFPPAATKPAKQGRIHRNKAPGA